MSETKHPIQIVARRTGLSVDVIRAWERRYNAVTPTRTETGRRLYSNNDVKKLTLLSRAISAGRRIGDVASLSINDLTQVIDSDEVATTDLREGARPRTGSVMDYFDSSIDAIRELNLHALLENFENAHRELGSIFLLDDLFGPLMRHIKEECKVGSLRQAQEKFTIETIKSFLMIESRKDVNEGDPKILITSPLSHKDELTMLKLCLVSKNSNWSPVYVGASVSPAEILFTYEQSNSKAIILVADIYGRDQYLPNEIRKIRSLVEDGEILIFGENIFNYQDIIKELKLMSAQNIGELKLRLEGMKNLCELKPVRLHAKPNKK